MDIWVENIPSRGKGKCKPLKRDHLLVFRKQPGEKRLKQSEQGEDRHRMRLGQGAHIAHEGLKPV